MVEQDVSMGDCDLNAKTVVVDLFASTKFSEHVALNVVVDHCANTEHEDQPANTVEVDQYVSTDAFELNVLLVVMHIGAQTMDVKIVLSSVACNATHVPQALMAVQR